MFGGVRRSAMISLSRLDDQAMAHAKSIYNVDEYSLCSETEEEWVYTITMKKHPSVRPTYRVVFKKGSDDWGKADSRATEDYCLVLH